MIQSVIELMTKSASAYCMIRAVKAIKEFHLHETVIIIKNLIYAIVFVRRDPVQYNFTAWLIPQPKSLVLPTSELDPFPDKRKRLIAGYRKLAYLIRFPY